MIDYKISENRESLRDLKKTWNDLFKSGNFEASTSYDWTYALVESEIKDEDSFVNITIQDNHEIVGIVPLIIRETKKKGFTLKNIFPISEIYNTHSDLLIIKKNDEYLDVFFQALFKLKYNWHVFRMMRIIENNYIIDKFESNLKRQKRHYEFSLNDPSFFITFGEKYSDYLKNRSNKFRNYLKRKTKKLYSIGNVECVGIDKIKDPNIAFNYLMEVEKKSWKNTHGTAITSIKKQKIFYDLLSKYTFENGWLHLYFLNIDKSPIAYNLGLIHNDTYLYLKTSYDENYRSYSPSTVLRAQMIEALFQDGIKYFDFPGEPYEWENQWTKEVRWHKSLVVYNKSLKSHIYAIYNNLITKKDKCNKEQINYYNPKDVKPS